MRNHLSEVRAVHGIQAYYPQPTYSTPRLVVLSFPVMTVLPAFVLFWPNSCSSQSTLRVIYLFNVIRYTPISRSIQKVSSVFSPFSAFLSTFIVQLGFKLSFCHKTGKEIFGVAVHYNAEMPKGRSFRDIARCRESNYPTLPASGRDTT